jgi:DNA-binding response OmpR family regulator
MNTGITPENNFSNEIILILEDDMTFRKYLVRVISSFFKGKIIETANPLKALEYMETEKPDLILLDLELPIMDGRATLLRIRSNPKTKDIPVLVCSAISYETLVVDLVKYKIEGYMIKPFKSITLINKIKSILDRTNAYANEY